MPLLSPSPDHEQAYWDFVRDWAEHGEDITPYFVRYLQESYAEFLAFCDGLTSWETCAVGFVPSSNFFLMEDDRLVGALNLRHALNPSLTFRGGHIGYGVRPSERGKGYAKQMLRLGLEKARTLGLEKVLVTCSKSNSASAAVIEHNGGILENEVDDDGDVTLRYWITLSPIATAANSVHQ